jgi:hypothetical protein
MKNILGLMIALLMFPIISCHKDKDNTVEGLQGKITGTDMRKCMCCGGYYIEIQDSTYRFDSIPINSGINISIDTFPIFVSVLFHKKNPQCLGDEIVIDKMKKD